MNARSVSEFLTDKKLKAKSHTVSLNMVRRGGVPLNLSRVANQCFAARSLLSCLKIREFKSWGKWDLVDLRANPGEGISAQWLQPPTKRL